MAISTQNVITIVDAVNYFNQKAQSILNVATYHSGNYPKFSGSCTGGLRGSNESTYLTNPNALPSDALAAKSITTLTISNGIITASTLWNSINNIAKTFNKVRRFSSNWQHKYDSAWQDKGTVTGHGVFNTSFPAVPTGSDATNGKSTRWTRSGGNVTLSPSQGTMVMGNLVNASQYMATIDNCYNEWYNKCYNNNTLSYTMYTCHANCHSQCYSNCYRNRR